MDYTNVIDNFLNYGAFISHTAYNNNNNIDVFYNAMKQGGCEKWFQFGLVGYLKSFPYYNAMCEFQIGSKQLQTYQQVDIGIIYPNNCYDLIELKIYVCNHSSINNESFCKSIEGDIKKLNSIKENNSSFKINRLISLSVVVSFNGQSTILDNFHLDPTANPFANSLTKKYIQMQKHFTSGVIYFEVMSNELECFLPPTTATNLGGSL